MNEKNKFDISDVELNNMFTDIEIEDVVDDSKIM